MSCAIISETFYESDQSLTTLTSIFQGLTISTEKATGSRSLSIPIHHLVFDIMRSEIPPLTLIQLSKTLYNQVAPILYRSIKLTTDNILPFFNGLILQQPSPNNGQTTFKVGYRKLAALSYVERLSFSDRATAEKFVKLMKFYANQFYQSSHSPPILPSVKHVHLQLPLVDALFTVFDDPTKPQTISMMLSIYTPMFLLILDTHCKPDCISFAWPSNWSGDRYITDDEDPALPYAGISFFKQLIGITGVEKIYVNVHLWDLQDIWLDFMADYEEIKISLNILIEKDTDDDRLLDEIESHFEPLFILGYNGYDREIEDLESRLTYNLPSRPGLSDDLAKRQVDQSGDIELWMMLNQMILFRPVLFDPIEMAGTEESRGSKDKELSEVRIF